MLKCFELNEEINNFDLFATNQIRYSIYVALARQLCSRNGSVVGLVRCAFFALCGKRNTFT